MRKGAAMRHSNHTSIGRYTRALVTGALGVALGATLLAACSSSPKATTVDVERAGRDLEQHHHRRHRAPHRARRPGLRRDRPGHERRVRMGQRPRRRQRPQDPLHLPRRRVQPRQHRHADPQARPPGQHLRRRRLARDADPDRGPGVPEHAEGAPALHRVGVQLLERSRRTPTARDGSPRTPSRARSSAATSRPTSPGKKIGYLYQGDEFGNDFVKGLDMEIPSTSVVSRQTYDAATLAGPAVQPDGGA